MKLITERRHVLAIERSEFGPPGTPGEDDLLLNVTTTVGGYSFAVQAWIMFPDWQRFLSELQELERLRKGQAILESFPDELRIVCSAIDRLGHMMVSGDIAWKASDEFSAQLKFGFEFDPGMLRTVVREFEALGH